MVIQLELESLAKNIPVMSEDAVGFYKQNCMICFHNNGHSTNVQMRVQYQEEETKAVVMWSGEVTEQLKRQYGDLKKATEHAACAIALMLIRELTSYTGVEQSNIGTTIDYYLAPKNQDDTLIFNHAMRLEVSGILKEDENNTVEARINSKIRRLKPDEILPSVIIVVEFSQPWAKMVQP